MKSLWCAGDFNLKGKKVYLCGCKCCDVVNLKDAYLKKLAIKEMKNEIGGLG